MGRGGFEELAGVQWISVGWNGREASTMRAASRCTQGWKWINVESTPFMMILAPRT